MNIAFYVSGTASRLRLLLNGKNSPLLDDTMLVISDSLLNSDIKFHLEKKNIKFDCFDYDDLGKSKIERRTNLSTRILKNLTNCNIDYCMCFGSHILTGDLLNVYKNKIINFHPSLLPKHKGLNAIDKSWVAEDKVFGNTAHFIDSGIDTGPILMQSIIPSYLVKKGDYSSILDLQLPMAHQIHAWLQKGVDVRFNNKTIQYDENSIKEITFFPNIELSLQIS